MSSVFAATLLIRIRPGSHSETGQIKEVIFYMGSFLVW